ncbi:MAG TPA: MlaD family protein [Syntrophales bacterium]|nr:MlaD family protein [Syntrophales bacterium]HOL59652.1 MlaD family protein [Syntrophales bacterium]HPO35798.1 MlaD family protein [Syntrophales bacterium]
MKRLSVEWKVGLFIILSLLIIVSALTYLAHKKGMFERGHTFTLHSRTGEGLTVGMPLHFSGFKIGKVTDLELSQAGLVVIKVNVPTRHVKWLRKDSRFVLERPILGSTKLTVITENMASPPLDPGFIPLVTEVNDINETIRKLEPLLVKVSLILDHVEKITGKMAERNSLLEMTISDEEAVKAVYESLKNVRKMTEHLNKILARTETELYGPEGIKPAVVDVLKEVIANLKKTEEVLDNVIKMSVDLSKSTKDIEVLRKDIDRAVHTINSVIDEINRKIPFKKEEKLELP